MRINKLRALKIFFLILGTASFVSCFKDITVKNDIFTNDFNASDAGRVELFGWNNGVFGPITAKFSHFNGETMVGPLNNVLLRVNSYSLPSHQAIHIELDLYLHNNWKNDHLWRVSFDNNDQLLTSFSNDPTIQQAYPNWAGNGSPLTAAGANAQNTDLPGICTLVTKSRATSMYHISITAAHSAQTFTLECNDSGGTANDTCNVSWSVDNLKISTLKN